MSYPTSSCKNRWLGEDSVRLSGQAEAAAFATADRQLAVQAEKQCLQTPVELMIQSPFNQAPLN